MKLSYRDYLIWKASHAAHALTEGIATASQMGEEEYAIVHLERTLDVTRDLVKYRNPNPERVEPRPQP